MNHKFQLKIFLGNILEGSMDWTRFKEVHRSLKNGDYELILREKINWDVSQSNKFFHGFVLQHFVQGYLNVGNCEYGREDVRRFLKAKFIGYDYDETIWNAVLMLDKYRNNTVIEPSTRDIKTYLATEKLCSEVGIVLPLISMATMKKVPQWTTFLNSLSALSIELFKCGLPVADKIEE